MKFPTLLLLSTRHGLGKTSLPGSCKNSLPGLNKTSLPGSCLVTRCLGGSASRHRDAFEAFSRLSLQFVELPGRSLVTSWLSELPRISLVTSWLYQICRRRLPCGLFSICGILSLLSTLVSHSTISSAAEPMRALILEGQNRHHGTWPKTSRMMASYLEQTSLFKFDVIGPIRKYESR